MSLGLCVSLMNAVVCVMGLAELGRCPGRPVMAAAVREEQFLEENVWMSIRKN